MLPLEAVVLETLRQARAAPAAESDLKNIKRLTKGRVDYFYTVFFLFKVLCNVLQKTMLNLR